MNTAPQENIAINTTAPIDHLRGKTENQLYIDDAGFNDPSEVTVADAFAPVEIVKPQETLSIENTVTVKEEPQAPLQHGLDHLKSRLIIAATAWNNTLGAGRREELLATNLVADSWTKISDDVANDVIADAKALNEVIWKPISYLINEIVTGTVNTENRKYAAILTTGQYVYLKVVNNNFQLVNETGDETVPAYKVVMIRETYVDIKDDYSEVILPESPYVRTVKPKPVANVRYAIKELQDERNFQKKTAKRRAANKVAKAQKRKTRK